MLSLDSSATIHQ